MRPIDAIIRLRDQFTPVLRRVSAGMQNHIKDHAKTAEQIKKSAAAQIRFGEEVRKTGNAISGFSKKCALLAAPLMGAAAAGLKLGSELTNGMAKVSTLVDTNVVDMQKLRKEIVNLSNDTGVAVTDLAEAQYQAISAGVDAEDSIKFLGVATKTARAGFTDTATAIDGLTTVINAYGMATDDAMKISDQMMTAQNFGKTTIDQMAGALGGVIPLAAQLDIKTEELFASIATLTRSGIKTDEAITGLKSTLSNIIDPSEKAALAAKALGIEFSAGALQGKGLQKFLIDIRQGLEQSAPAYTKLIDQHDQLKKSMQGVKKGTDEYKALNKQTQDIEKQMEIMAKTADSPIAKYAALFGNIRALNSVMVLTGKGADDFAKAIDLMDNSAGTTEKAYAKLQTPSKETQDALIQLANAGMELATGLSPLMKTGTLLIKEFAKWLNSLTEEQKNFLTYAARNTVIFILLGGAIGKTIGIIGKGISAFGKFNQSFRAAGSVGKYFEKEHARLDGAIKGFIKSMKTAGSISKNFLTAMGQPLVMFGQMFTDAFRHPIVAVRLMKDSVMASLKSMKTGLLNGVSSLRGGILNGITSIKNGISVGLNLARSGVTSFIKGIVQIATNPIAAFKTLSSGLLSIFRGIAAGARLLFMNPIGIAVAVIIGLAYLIYKNWGQIKEFFSKTFIVIGQKVQGVAGKFALLFDKATAIFSKLTVRVKALWNSFSGGGAVIEQVLQIVGELLGAGFSTAINIAIVVVEGFANTIAAALDGVLQVLNGVIDFLTGVFTGNWTLAWQGIVEIFSGVFSGISGICEAVLGTVKETINSVITGINGMSFDIPDWVPGVGGNHFQLSVPMLAKGTENWPGGPAMIHDRGAEIVDLPRGSRVIPHDRSLQIAKQEGIRDAAKLQPVFLQVPKFSQTSTPLNPKGLFVVQNPNTQFTKQIEYRKEKKPTFSLIEKEKFGFSNTSQNKTGMVEKKEALKTENKQIIIQKIADKIVIGSGDKQNMNELVQELERMVRKAVANSA